jgi:hypothetical protein
MNSYALTVRHNESPQQRLIIRFIGMWLNLPNEAEKPVSEEMTSRDLAGGVCFGGKYGQSEISRNVGPVITKSKDRN